jgi:hypothetical protein
MQRPIVIIGNNARQVQTYARQQLQLNPSEYRMGKDARSLVGMRGGVLIELEGCRQTTDYYELQYVAIDRQFIKINVLW